MKSVMKTVHTMEEKNLVLKRNIRIGTTNSYLLAEVTVPKICYNIFWGKLYSDCNAGPKRKIMSWNGGSTTDKRT